MRCRKKNQRTGPQIRPASHEENKKGTDGNVAEGVKSISDPESSGFRPLCSVQTTSVLPIGRLRTTRRKQVEPDMGATARRTPDAAFWLAVSPDRILVSPFGVDDSMDRCAGKTWSDRELRHK